MRAAPGRRGRVRVRLSVLICARTDGVRALIVLAILLIAAPARAHQSSVKYIDITVDGAVARIEITIAPGDVTEALGLPNDATPPVAEALVPTAAAYVRGWFTLRVDDATACAPGPASARPDPDGRFVIVSWEADCHSPVEVVELDATRFFALDKQHEAIITVHTPGNHGEPTIVRANDPPVVRIAVAQEASLGAWIRYGMDHIYGGLDHVLFVLSLLLVVVIARAPDGWQLRRPLDALRSTAAIITAFTVAHSVSLIAASLGWVHLPSRFVESVIAASIVYTAIENVVRPDVRWRFALTCMFGLVHGLGFASMLEELLPPTDVLVPLLTFNLGVELGQLTVVAVALPVLWLLARLLGPVRYRRYALPGAAILLVGISIQWLVERAFAM